MTTLIEALNIEHFKHPVRSDAILDVRKAGAPQFIVYYNDSKKTQTALLLERNKCAIHSRCY
ncbi:hypothetical protein G163CM_10890 [Pseudocitrobacter corydidari]|uniref:Uncharacterized protein n=1 Tax=Pseudocitrobacter corydidari TaxID=2891570 RepID=A0ABY3S2U3_9ENTR|nr:hypothetical protein G163CM_10890 [Pseudocitrobacter corydidari]